MLSIWQSSGSGTLCLAGLSWGGCCGRLKWKSYKFTQKVWALKDKNHQAWSRGQTALLLPCYLLEWVTCRECSCVSYDPWRWSCKVLQLPVVIRRLRSKLMSMGLHVRLREEGFSSKHIIITTNLVIYKVTFFFSVMVEWWKEIKVGNMEQWV